MNQHPSADAAYGRTDCVRLVRYSMYMRDFLKVDQPQSEVFLEGHFFICPDSPFIFTSAGCSMGCVQSSKIFFVG